MTQNELLPGDSANYELLEKGIQLSANVEGLTIELGVRRGGGTFVIMDAIKRFCPNKVHIAVDPYGNIEYEHKEGEIVRLDYNNEMRNDCMKNLFEYAKSSGAIVFFNLEDIEFFKRFADGVPTYNHVKTIYTKYSFVHFDAAHSIDPLKTEIDFFMSRIDKGACFVFDDVEKGVFYDHDIIDTYLKDKGFTLIELTGKKALYQW